MTIVTSSSKVTQDLLKKLGMPARCARAVLLFECDSPVVIKWECYLDGDQLSVLNTALSANDIESEVVDYRRGA